MHRKSIWVWCLTLLVGCSQEVDPPKRVISVAKRPGTAEVKTPTAESRIVAKGSFTFSVTNDLEDHHRYMSSTEHNCAERTSVLRYLAVYDEESRLINEDRDLEIEVDFEPGSVGEVEFELACLAPALEGNNV